MKSESENKKKLDELRILKYVFDTQEFKSYKHLDKPDFWIELENKQVGVEVTQFYNSDSLARLDKIPNYGDQLLDTKNYKHKVDKNEIPVVDVTLINQQTNQQTEIKAIKLPNYDINHYLDKLSTAIKEKDNVFNQYNEGLTHIDLIISDETEFLYYVHSDNFYDTVCKPKIINLLLRSPFREIYLVSTISKSKYYFPLKLLIFYSHTFLFQNIIRKVNDFPKEVDPLQYLNWTGEFLAKIGFQKLGLQVTEDYAELVCGQLSYHIKDSKNPIIRDYTYFDPSINKQIQQTEFFQDNIEPLVEEEVKNFRVQTNLRTEIKD